MIDMIYMNGGEDVSHMGMWINRKKSDVGKDGCDKKDEKQRDQKERKKNNNLLKSKHREWSNH